MTLSLTTILAALSAIGSVASIVGIYFTFKQVKSVKQIAEETRQEMNKTDAISDIVTCNSLIKESIPLLKQGNLELALIKLRDVKDKIISLKIIVEQFELDEFQQVFQTNIATHIDNLSHNINTIDDNHKTPKSLNLAFICKAMDDLSSFIVETHARITNKITH